MPPFEVDASLAAPPETKLELVKLIDAGKAIPFHMKICQQCHTIPKYQEWVMSPIKGIAELTNFTKLFQ